MSAVQWLKWSDRNDATTTHYTQKFIQNVLELHGRLQIIEFLEENGGFNFTDTDLCTVFVDLTLKAREIKAKINQWDYIKLKSLSIRKETIIKTRRQSTEREKIFANYVSDKGLKSKIWKEFMQLHTKTN